MNWIIDWVPWWLWFVLGGGGLLATMSLWLPLATAVWSALPTPVRFLLGGFLAALAAYLAGRNRGRSNAKDEAAKRDAAATKNRLETNKEVSNMSKDQREKELDRWRRD